MNLFARTVNWNDVRDQDSFIDLDYLRFSNRKKTGLPIFRSIQYATHISCQRSCLLWHYDSEKHKGFLEYRVRVDQKKLAGLHNLKCFFHWIIVNPSWSCGVYYTPRAIFDLKCRTFTSSKGDLSQKINNFLKIVFSHNHFQLQILSYQNLQFLEKDY